MLGQDYLNLKWARVKGAEWKHEGSARAFIFVRRGQGQFTCGTTVHPMQPGDLLLLGNAPEGKVTSSNGGELTFQFFSPCFEQLVPLFDAKEIGLLEHVLNKLSTIKRYPASSPLAVECHQLLDAVAPQFTLEHRSDLLRIVARLLSAELDAARVERIGFIPADEHMIQVFDSLTADEIQNLCVDELAHKFGCSRRHLNRLFHQYFGVSVAGLKSEMRMMKAVFLLQQSSMKVIEVAERCGFNHSGLFNTCFKRRFGSSPREWRKLGSKQQQTPSLGVNTSCKMHELGMCPWASHSAHPALAKPGCALPAGKTVNAPARLLGAR